MKPAKRDMYTKQLREEYPSNLYRTTLDEDIPHIESKACQNEKVDDRLGVLNSALNSEIVDKNCIRDNENSEKNVLYLLPGDKLNQTFAAALERSMKKTGKNFNDLGLDEGHQISCASTLDISVRSLRIDGFVRPLLVSRVKKLIAETGTIEGFWMNRIKSFCYVILPTSNDATITLKVVQGLNFPPERTDHLTLSVKYVSLIEARDVIDGKVILQPSLIQSHRNDKKHVQQSSHCRLNIPHCLEHTSMNSSSQVTYFTSKKRHMEIPRNDEGDSLICRELSTKTVLNLDKLYYKTVSIPCIYWFPVSKDKVSKID